MYLMQHVLMVSSAFLYLTHERIAAFSFQPKMSPVLRLHCFHRRGNASRKESFVSLNMGMFDFFKNRNSDFVKLESTSTFGPGPLLLLYNIPSSMDDEEIMDMIHDGAPLANKQGVKLGRIGPDNLEDSMLGEKTVESILNQAMQDGFRNSNEKSIIPNDDQQQRMVPILYFSGFSNAEMMATYNIIAQEIYMETNGLANAACAKAVKPAMTKPFRQLLDEISRDHLQATMPEDILEEE